MRGETPHYLNEKRYCRKDGTVVWVRFNASFLRDGGGRALRTAAVLRNITARKQAELALQESEDFNTSVLNSIVDHLAVLDASGTIVAVNEAWKRFALENGAPDLAAHSVGLSYRASCTGAPGDSSASQTAEGLRAVLAGERPNFQLDYPCHSSDRERWFHLRITPLKGRRGGAIVSHTDITHRNRAEAALRESEDLLQRIGEIAKVGAWELDLRTHQVTWSQEHVGSTKSIPGTPPPSKMPCVSIPRTRNPSCSRRSPAPPNTVCPAGPRTASDHRARTPNLGPGRKGFGSLGNRAGGEARRRLPVASQSGGRWRPRRTGSPL